MDSGFSVDIAKFDGEVVVALHGEIDMASAEALRDAVEPYLGPKQTIALDLSGVTFADSSLLSFLVQARGALVEHGGTLLLRNPSEAAHRILQIGELIDLVDTEVDRQDEG
jgi:anti-sigma B factor antagonist